MQNRPGALPWTRALGPWIPVVLWAGVVWMLGGDSFSHPETSRIIGPVLRWLIPTLGDDSLQVALFWIRRSAHVGEYGLLALLALRAWLRTTRTPAWAARAGAFGLCLLLAAADEWRQAGSALRTGSPFDVLLDLAGVSLALLGVPPLLRALGLGALASSEPAATRSNEAQAESDRV